MNDRAFVVLYFAGFMLAFLVLLLASCLFWRVFDAVKGYVLDKRRAPQRAARKRPGRTA